MKYYIFVFFLTILSDNIFAQIDQVPNSEKENSIEWNTYSFIDSMKIHAKTVNRYILVDCYTTWCAPCKKMDEEVFTDSTVKTIINQYFHPVKVQMDSNRNKKELTYLFNNNIANSIITKYQVHSFPTYLILSPEGTLVHKIIGYQPATNFIENLYLSLTQKKDLMQQYNKYLNHLKEFEEGKLTHVHLPGMIKIATALMDIKTVKRLSKAHLDSIKPYMYGPTLTKDQIETLVKYADSPEIFPIFFLRETFVNSIMGKDYASHVVDAVIMKTITDEFLGFTKNTMTRRKKPDSNPDWDILYTKIQSRYNTRFAKRGILKAKASWNKFYNDVKSFSKYYTTFIRKYGVDTVQADNNDAMLNNNAWRIFKYVTNQTDLVTILKVMEQVVKRNPEHHWYVDTYANLLYKSGRLRKAIYWESRALALAISTNNEGQEQIYRNTLAAFRSKTPTWPMGN